MRMISGWHSESKHEVQSEIDEVSPKAKNRSLLRMGIKVSAFVYMHVHSVLRKQGPGNVQHNVASRLSVVESESSAKKRTEMAGF